MKQDSARKHCRYTFINRSIHPCILTHRPYILDSKGIDRNICYHCDRNIAVSEKKKGSSSQMERNPKPLQTGVHTCKLNTTRISLVKRGSNPLQTEVRSCALTKTERISFLKKKKRVPDLLGPECMCAKWTMPRNPINIDERFAESLRPRGR